MSSVMTDTPAAPPAHEHPNQFALLRQRRFAPFFWTQFSGAANDNLFKFAFTVMVTYLERQRVAEQLPDAQRREELSYDTALARLSKGVCPGCERVVALNNDKIDFCPHCGICLFDHCGPCSSRKSAFAKFCHACGTGAGPGLTRLVPGPAGTA